MSKFALGVDTGAAASMAPPTGRSRSVQPFTLLSNGRRTAAEAFCSENRQSRGGCRTAVDGRSRERQ